MVVGFSPASVCRAKWAGAARVGTRDTGGGGQGRQPRVFERVVVEEEDGRVEPHGRPDVERAVAEVAAHGLAVAGPAVRGAEPGVACAGARADPLLDACAIEALMVLAPADGADEALVAEVQAEAAALDRGPRAREAQERLVHLGDLRVRDDGAAAHAVVEGACGAVPVPIAEAEVGDALELDPGRQALPGLRLVAEGEAQGRGLAPGLEGVVAHALVPVAQGGLDLALRECLAEAHPLRLLRAGRLAGGGEDEDGESGRRGRTHEGGATRAAARASARASRTAPMCASIGKGSRIAGPC